jgi:Ser/Thr protein kinase RdoA (MazF antagonist)
MKGSDPRMWAQLSRPDLAERECYGDVVRRALGHLGEYVELIVRPLNMRPVSAALLRVDAQRIEVRVSSAASHVVLVIAPDVDAAGELFWLRALAGRRAPVPPMIAHDLSATQVPFGYLVLGYATGTPLAEVADDARMRVAARQIGRAVRRMHQAPAPGFGRPAPSGRWPSASWEATLQAWLARTGALEAAHSYLGDELYAAFEQATVGHPDLACEEARVLHGAVGPSCALVTASESIQLEALVRPGAIVAGDPLFDLAHALLPHQPQAFRGGFLEGYAALGPLDPRQRLRLRRLGLLALLAHAAQHPAHQSERIPALVAAELELLA